MSSLAAVKRKRFLLTVDEPESLNKATTSETPAKKSRIVKIVFNEPAEQSCSEPSPDSFDVCVMPKEDEAGRLITWCPKSLVEQVLIIKIQHNQPFTVGRSAANDYQVLHNNAFVSSTHGKLHSVCPTPLVTLDSKMRSLPSSSLTRKKLSLAMKIALPMVQPSTTI